MNEDQAPSPSGTPLPDGRSSVQYLPRESRDDEAIVRLHDGLEPDGPPLTVERHAARWAEIEGKGWGESWVAVLDGRLLGVGGFWHAWWTDQPDTYAVELQVDSAHRRRGIGSELARVLESRLRERGATRLHLDVRADAADGHGYATRHGFVPTGHMIDDYRLDVEGANITGLEELEHGLHTAGIWIRSLAEMGTVDDPFQRALQRLWAGGEGRAPEPERLAESFDSWRDQVLLAPGLSPETHWVALHAGRPVGMTFLTRLSPDAAENDFTIVDPAYRRRGIAPALKLHAIRWARAHGIRSFHTSSEIGNAAMIAINRRLGYVVGARRVEMGRDFA